MKQGQGRKLKSMSFEIMKVPNGELYVLQKGHPTFNLCRKPHFPPTMEIVRHCEHIWAWNVGGQKRSPYGEVWEEVHKKWGEYYRALGEADYS